jgi:hypothetical protein
MDEFYYRIGYEIDCTKENVNKYIHDADTIDILEQMLHIMELIIERNK